MPISEGCCSLSSASTPDFFPSITDAPSDPIATSFERKVLNSIEKNFFLKIWIWIQMVIQMCNPDPDSAKSGSGLHIWITIWMQIQIFKKKISKKILFLNFYFSLCHYYENITNLPLNKSEGPYTTKLVKLYITYFVIFKLFKLLKLFSLSGSFLFLKVEVTPNKSSSWILISYFVKLAQSEHSLQNVHNKHGQHG